MHYFRLLLFIHASVGNFATHRQAGICCSFDVHDDIIRETLLVERFGHYFCSTLLTMITPRQNVKIYKNWKRGGAGGRGYNDDGIVCQ